MKIFIDAGHGGKDPGATGNSLVEKNLNLKVALLLEARLKHFGFEVMLSRYSDEDVSLQQRTDKANAWGAYFFLSIHHNGFTDPAARGIETYYSVRDGDSKLLTEKIQNALCKVFSMSDRGAKARINSSGKDWFHVLRESKAPVAMITETGFVTSPFDAETLKRLDFPETQAEILAVVIKAAYGQDVPEIEKLQSQVNELTDRVDRLYKFLGDASKIIPPK